MKVLANILKPYQKEGVHFLVQHHRAILADDPGLGKTIQTLAAIRELQVNLHIGRVLIVCPKMAIGVWEDEIQLWLEELSIRYEGTPKKRQGILKSYLQDDVPFLICTYGMVRELADIGIHWNTVVCDEIHRGGLQNHKTKTFQAVERLIQTNLFLLTGTPVKAGPQDLYAPLRLINRKAFPSYWKFAYTHCIVEQEHFGKKILGRPSNPAQFRAMLSNYLIHRKFSQVQNEVPPKVRQAIRVEMTTKQHKLYAQLRDELFAVVGDQLVMTNNQVALITKLRQLLVSPQLLGGDDIGAAIPTAINLAQEEFEEGRSVILFTPYRQAVTLIRNCISMRGICDYIGVIQGGMDADAIKTVVKRFQENLSPNKILICTIKTAASYTATAASTAIFIGYEWNPNHNIQAEDRITRIGQTKMTRALYLLHKGTVDDRIRDVLNAKQKWANMILTPKDF